MPIQKLIRAISLLSIISMMGSCMLTHRIAPDEVFLKKQLLVLHDKPIARDTTTIAGKTINKIIPGQRPHDYAVSDEELLSISKLKPNRRILWARFNLGIYTLVPKKALERSEVRANNRCQRKNAKRASKGKSPKFCKSIWMWMAYTIGEPPAQLDSAKMEKSVEQMSALLKKRGYFNNDVQAEVIYRKKGLVWWRKGKKCRVEFNVYPGQPYRVRNIKYKFEDFSIAEREQGIRQISTVMPNSIFDVDKFDAERENVANFLNNHGYYSFTKDYIVFDADSSLKTHQVDVTMVIKGIREVSPLYPDSTIVVNHKRYFLGDISMITEYDPRNPDAPMGTSLVDNGLTIQSKAKLKVNASLLSCANSLQKGEMYQREKFDETYRRLTQLGIFKSVTLQLVPRPTTDSTGANILDIKMLLAPAKRQSFSFGSRATNRAGNMGIYGNIVYIHKNLFTGAERFEARITGGLEAAQIVGQSNTGTDINATSQLGRNLRLNSFEIGPEITLKLPRLFPLSYCSSGKNSSPSTSFSALVNYQIRPDYERTLGQIGLSWNWIENPTRVSRMTIDGIELSIISINKSDAFEAFLDKLNDRFLANSYSNHIIEASRITYIINTQKKADQRRSYYLRMSGEAAGNVLRGFKQYVIKEPLQGSDYYKIANIQFAQYFKGEVDYRYYFTANPRNKFVARAYAGVGVARKNFLVLPFEKSFFSGGANGIRAWQARTMGPGSYRDPANAKTYNNIGDIKLEFNLEYRFKLTQMFQAAFFVDAGNIWVLRPDEIRTGAQFKFDSFLSEVAVGSGLGIRIDFEYFLVRMDVGLQMKDPSKVQGERWFFEPKNEYNQFIQDHNFDVREYNVWRTRVFNLGIGFPF